MPAARVTDSTLHASCVAPIPGPKGMIIPAGEPTVLIGGPTFSMSLLDAIVAWVSQEFHFTDLKMLSAATAAVGQMFDDEGLNPDNPTDATAANSSKIGTDAERRAILLKHLGALPFSLIWPCPPLTPREQFVSDMSNTRISNEYPDKDKAQVEADLQKIYNTPGGKTLLKDLNDTGKTTVIGPPKGYPDQTGGNCTTYDNSKDAVNGNGTGSTITYDPRNNHAFNPPHPDDPDWANRPPAVGLGHELIHADHAAHGNVEPGQQQNDKGDWVNQVPGKDPITARDDSVTDSKGNPISVNKEELDTVGPPAHGFGPPDPDGTPNPFPPKTGPTTENELRDQWCAANPDDCKGDQYPHTADGKLAPRDTYVPKNREKDAGK
jgi:hypothetical protein